MSDATGHLGGRCRRGGAPFGVQLPGLTRADLLLAAIPLAIAIIGSLPEGFLALAQFVLVVGAGIVLLDGVARDVPLPETDSLDRVPPIRKQ